MKLWDNVFNAADEAFVSELLEEERAAEQRCADMAEEFRTEKGEERRAVEKTGRQHPKKWLIPAAACLILGVLIWGIAGGLFSRWAGNTWKQWNAYLHPPIDEQPQALIREYRIVGVSDGPYAGFRPVRVCEEDRVGEKIGEVTVYAAWLYVSTKGVPLREPFDNEKETLRAEVHALRNIAPETAVCVKYLDKSEALTLDHYYTFIDPAAVFASPAAFFAAFNAAETLLPDGATAGALVENVKLTDIRNSSYFLNAEAAAALRDKLLTLDGTASQDTEEQMFSSCEKRASIQVDMSSGLSGRLSLLSSGYLSFRPDNLWDTADQIFRISPSDAADLIRLIEDRGTLNVPDDSGTVIATTGTDIAIPE